MLDALRVIDSAWVLVSLFVFAFLLGVRVCYAFLQEAKGIRSSLMKNNKIDERQQRQIDAATRENARQREEIDYVMKRVNDVMHNKRVKKITIKRREKVEHGHQAKGG